MRAALRRIGNSSGVIIPKALMFESGMAVGDAVEITCEEGKIIVAPVERLARAGWAEASKALAQAGDDSPVWPEFGNAADADLVW